MTQHNLPAQKRKLFGRQVKKLRVQGLVPANIFGKQIKSQAVQINAKEFSTLYSQVGESGLIYLAVEGESEPHPVLVREVVYHPVSGQILHVSFNQVNLKEKVTAPVEVELVGESPAETTHVGILVQQLNEVEVEALPTDIPERIEMDVTGLAEVGSSLFVSDIHVSKNVELLTSADTLIAKIEPLAKEEVVAPPSAEEGETPAVSETSESETSEAASEAPAEESES